MTHESFMTILTKKISKFFLLKWSYYDPCVKFDRLLRENGLFLFFLKKAPRKKSVEEKKCWAIKANIADKNWSLQIIDIKYTWKNKLIKLHKYYGDHDS